VCSAVPQRIVTFKIDEGLLEALDRYARARQMTRSEAIRDAIEKLLRAEGVYFRKSEERPDPRSIVIEIPV
jgi:metal-responsive CopG/Arc/MetJ family transcriptional regulator